MFAMQVTGEMVRRAIVAERVRKHASHDQSSHGNWAIDPRMVSALVPQCGSVFSTYPEMAARFRSPEGLARSVVMTADRIIDGDVFSLSDTDELAAFEIVTGETPWVLHDLRRRFGIMESAMEGWGTDWLNALAKHGTHDQSSHGNWADGLSSGVSTVRSAIISAAQEVYDSWEVDEEGYDDEFGGGGICDAISDCMSTAINDALPEGNFQLLDGGQDGDDHAWVIVADHDRREAVGVDIHPSHYETGGGYSWQKIPGVKFTEDMVDVFPMEYSDIFPDGPDGDYDFALHGDHDQSSHGNWADGFRKPDYVPIPEGASDDEVTAHMAEQRRIKEEWESRVTSALAHGEMTAAQASELGWRGNGHDTDSNGDFTWQPLPPDLYHVTGQASKVRSEGLKTRAELGEGTAGLGGGTSNTLSFTTDPNLAREIRESMVEARHVLNGEITLDELLDNAATGADAERPYLKDALGYWGWSDKEGFPPAVEDLKAGIERKGSSGMPYSPAEWAAKHGEGWTGSDEWPTVHPEKGKLYTSYTRPLSEERRREQVFDVYRTLIGAREQAGGRSDPLFWNPNVEAIASLDPGDIQIMHYKPKPGAQGFPMGGMSEWRTTHGDILELVDSYAKHGSHDQKTHGNRPGRLSFTAVGGVIALPDSLGLDRSDMPQVPGALVGAFFDSLRSDGVSIRNHHVPASSLKPIQRHISRSRTDYAKEGIVAGVPKLLANRSLISNDGYIVDGHHRWAAFAELGQDIPVTEVDLGVHELLAQAREFNTVHAIEARPLENLVKRMLAAIRKHGSHDQSDHGNWARGSSAAASWSERRAETYDLHSLADPIFETSLSVGGSSYRSRVDTIKERGVSLQVEGSLLSESGETVGSFTRMLLDNGEAVLNTSLHVYPPHQGKGIGLAFTNHWEGEYRKAGFKRMELGAINIGRYAWAIEGYTWLGGTPSPTVMTAALDFEDRFRSDTPPTIPGSEWGQTIDFDIPADSPAWGEWRNLISDYESGANIQPVDLAMVGASHPGPSGWHLGKFFMLSVPDGWAGEKEL